MVFGDSIPSLKAGNSVKFYLCIHGRAFTERANDLQEFTADYIERSPELARSNSIPVTLTQIIDLKNYYVNSPEGRKSPESIDARSKFDIYKFQLSQHGKSVTGDPNLKMTSEFFKTFESQQVTLSVADRANLDAASAFATERAQIAFEIAQASLLEPKQHGRGCSR